jgi:hypothetical protein
MANKSTGWDWRAGRDETGHRHAVPCLLIFDFDLPRFFGPLLT